MLMRDIWMRVRVIYLFYTVGSQGWLRFRHFVTYRPLLFFLSEMTIGNPGSRIVNKQKKQTIFLYYKL